jgi:O-antigen biosynthesis protein
MAIFPINSNRGLRSRYYRWRDRLLPLGTRRRLLLVLLLELTVKTDRPWSLRSVGEFLRNMWLFVSDRTTLEERLRGPLSERANPLATATAFALPFSSTGGHEVPTLNFPRHHTPLVSVVIPVFNKWTVTAQCLASLVQVPGDIPFEVIVVDNGSTDETNRCLQNVENICRIRNAGNVGFVDACNQGILAARGEYILFLNNDTVVTEGFLANMVGLMDRDKGIGLVGAKLVYPDGRLQEAGGIVWNDEVNIAWNYGRFDHPGKQEYNYVKDVDYCSGACLLARREALFSVGLFDRRFSPAYFEDTDLAFSMRAVGYRVLYQPKSVVYHLEGATAGTDVSSGLKCYQEVNRSKFLEKWGSAIGRDHFPCGEHLFLARDRGRFRKVMFYMDHQVPAYDRDAGSLITFQYLRVFSDMGLKIVFWPDDMQNPEPYTSELQQMGIEVMYGYGNLDAYMKKFGRYFDYVVLSRPLFSLRYIDCARKFTKAKILYVGHDLHYLREQRRAVTEKNRGLARYARRLKAKELSLMKKSDLTLLFSDFERQVVAEEEPGIAVEVMPWIQDTHEVEREFSERRDIFFLGSFGHKPNVDGLLWFVEEIWPIVRSRLPGVRLIVAGSGATEEVLALAGPDILVKGYVHDTRPYYQGSKVFIAPLRYGAGVKGKVVEAMSHGLPVVTTSVGVEGLSLKDGETVFVTDSPDEFAERVFRLFGDELLWQKLSDGGLRFVKESFSPENGMAFCRTILDLPSGV